MNTLPSRLLAAVASLSLTACSLGSSFEAPGLTTVERRLPPEPVEAGEMPQRLAQSRVFRETFRANNSGMAVPQRPLAGLGGRVWRTDVPGVDRDPVVTFDPDRGWFLYFGVAGTWAFTGAEWKALRPAHEPARPTTYDRLAMTWDAQRHVAVLFDGTDASTWEFDGRDWTRVTTPSAPAPRRGFSLVFDEKRGVVVLVNGFKLDDYDWYRDVWEYDGANWSMAAEPIPQWISSKATWDPVEEKVVVIGQGDTAYELMRWDGRSWSSTYTAGPSSPVVQLSRLIFDRSRGELVSLSLAKTTPYTGDLLVSHALTPAGWVRDSNLELRAGAWVPVWDSRAGRVAMFGTSSNIVRLRDRGQWSTLRLGPPPMSLAAFDEARGHMVAVGFSDDTWSDETWERREGKWVLVDEAAFPPRMGIDTLTWDPQRKVMLMTGGPSNSVQLWSWDGSAWTQLQSPPGLATQGGQAAGFDRRRGVLVLYGGREPGFSSVGDSIDALYEWNGTGWLVPAQVNAPHPRTVATLAWDESAQTLRMVGGLASYNGLPPVTLAESWTWDGQRWTQTQPNAPVSRAAASYVWDPKSRRMVVAGGFTVGTSTFWDENDATWTFDGLLWRHENLATPPSNLVSDGTSLQAYSGGFVWELVDAP